ncbi:MAG: DUF4398 domain-containing protein [Myxococcota bacterium]|nr:DUF4398 domain-containing protein [Myxococcota bacterium]
MKRSTLLLITTTAVGIGCGGSYPAPAQHLADAQSAERSAAELGAASQPKAQLHLQLAHEQIASANTAIQEGDNEKADRLLARARSDAELAIALTREEGAKGEAQKASADSNTQRTTNANANASANATQGARP